MSNIQADSKPAIKSSSSQRVDMKLEVAVLPVSDVDRAKRFYADLGWRIDADFARADGSRAVQLTPPGSPASIQLGTAPLLYLVVSDIEAARAELIAGGVDASEVFHRGPQGRLSGPDPERPSYGSLATFSDPDGNAWLMQQVTGRLPRLASSPARSGMPRQRMASRKSGSAITTKAGRTGTPTTSSASRPGRNCRNKSWQRIRARMS